MLLMSCALATAAAAAPPPGIPDCEVDACWLPWPPEDCDPPDEVEEGVAMVTTDDVEEPVGLPGAAAAKMAVPGFAAAPLEIVDVAVVVAEYTADVYAEMSDDSCAVVITSDPF
jgi:hypothetical protein